MRISGIFKNWQEMTGRAATSSIQNPYLVGFAFFFFNITCCPLWSFQAEFETTIFPPPNNFPLPLFPRPTSGKYTKFDTPRKNKSHLMGWKTFTEPLEEMELAIACNWWYFKGKQIGLPQTNNPAFSDEGWRWLLTKRVKRDSSSPFRFIIFNYSYCVEIE